MSKLYDCILKYHLLVDSIKKTPYCTILYGGKANYLWKEKNNSTDELFDYFEKIQYSHYLSKINEDQDPYELYYYFEDTDDTFLKGGKLVEAFSSLHKKSMHYEELDGDSRKDIYEHFRKKILDTRKYYEDLQNFIEQMPFPRVDYYHLINHVSLFYRSLFMAESFLEEWYQKQPDKIRKAYVIHNTSLDFFCSYDIGYFIDYSECSYDYMIYDFLFFYRKDVLKLDMKSLFEKYDDFISLDLNEKKLLFSLLCIPEILDFTSSVYSNTVKITNEINILDKTFQFMSEENEKDQETNEEKLEE